MARIVFRTAEVGQIGRRGSPGVPGGPLLPPPAFRSPFMPIQTAR